MVGFSTTMLVYRRVIYGSEVVESEINCMYLRFVRFGRLRMNYGPLYLQTMVNSSGGYQSGVDIIHPSDMCCC
jgi:hypothetical protein